MQEIPSIAKLKKQAKKNKKTTGLMLSQEQQNIAKQLGFSSWESLLKHNPSANKIQLSLENVVPEGAISKLDGFGFPNFELHSDNCNLGVICGAAGSGKTVLLNILLERHIKQGKNVTFIDACTYGMETLKSQIERGSPYHDIGTIMNTRLLMLYPEQVRNITTAECLPSVSSNEILVVDDCLYPLANERQFESLKRALEQYVLTGGITILCLQRSSEITELFTIHETIRSDDIDNIVGFMLDKSRENLDELRKHEPFNSDSSILKINSRQGEGSWLIASSDKHGQVTMSVGAAAILDHETIHNMLHEIC